jgi:hypothetical protein
VMQIRLALVPAKSEQVSPKTKPSTPKQRWYSAQQRAAPATAGQLDRRLELARKCREPLKEPVDDALGGLGC